MSEDIHNRAGKNYTDRKRASTGEQRSENTVEAAHYYHFGTRAF